MEGTLMTSRIRRRAKPATVQIDAALYRQLQLKAAETGQSISDLVNDAVRAAFAEDAYDVDTFAARVVEADFPFEDAVRNLQLRGAL